MPRWRILVGCVSLLGAFFVLDRALRAVNAGILLGRGAPCTQCDPVAGLFTVAAVWLTLCFFFGWMAWGMLRQQPEPPA